MQQKLLFITTTPQNLVGQLPGCRCLNPTAPDLAVLNFTSIFYPIACSFCLSSSCRLFNTASLIVTQLQAIAALCLLPLVNPFFRFVLSGTPMFLDNK